MLNPFASMKGDHAAVRVPDLDVALLWFTEKLDFRVTDRWPFGDLRLAYVAPPVDTGFKIELIAGPGASDRPGYEDLPSSLGVAG